MGERVRVRFVTKFPEYADAQGDFDLPTTLNRAGLSAALNQIFDEEEPIPFDFKINGNFLRQTLGQALKLYHISVESLVTVEFFPAFRPPEMEEQKPVNGWVSCIRLVDDVIAYSMYNEDEERSGSVHIGETELKTSTAVKSFAVAESKVIAGDLEGCVTLFDADGTGSSSFSLHNGPVQCIETCSSLSHLFITGGADSSIQMWSDEGEGKFLAGFFGHTDSIQSLKWISEDTLLSASLDRTIRLWDTNTQQQKSVLPASCGVLSASMNDKLIITGHPDRTIKLWDTRIEVRQAVSCEFKSHRNWVCKVEWYDNEVFASASYDGSVKLWNAGTIVPLSTIFQHDEKVLALAVDENILVAGGSDSKLHKYRFRK